MEIPPDQTADLLKSRQTEAETHGIATRLSEWAGRYLNYGNVTYESAKDWPKCCNDLWKLTD
jgi:hypothetical protein